MHAWAINPRNCGSHCMLKACMTTHANHKRVEHDASSPSTMLMNPSVDCGSRQPLTYPAEPASANAATVESEGCTPAVCCDGAMI